MKQKIFIFLLGGAIFAAAIFIYFQTTTGEEAINPVVVIGLDGADWNIIDPLLQQGKLPHLEGLIREGSWGVLETFRPTKSPVVWTSIATGKTMLKHGILDYSFVAKNDIEVPYSGGERRVKAFWNILSEREYTVGVINWFCTFPPEEVNGYLVSDRYRLGVLKYPFKQAVTFPATLDEKIYPQVVRMKERKYRKIIKEEGIEDYLEKIKKKKISFPQNRLPQLKRFQVYALQDKSIENISLFLFDRVPVDLFATYFRLIDITSHFGSLFVTRDQRQKWVAENEKYGKPTPETAKLLYLDMADFIEPIYTYLDNVIGRIMSKARENTTFVVVSDHGFNFSKKGYRHYDTLDIPHGIVILKGPNIKSGHRLEKANVFDITPTLLYLFDLPLGKDMDGRVLLDAFEDKFARKRKIRYIPTFEGPYTSTPKRDVKALDKEVLEELRSLGYIK